MKSIIFLFFILSTFSVFSQVSKNNKTKILLYDKVGNIVINENDAITLKAIIKEDDTTYVVRWYKNTGVMQKQESFKDSLLTIKHGRYVWYDSLGNVDSTGYMLNGLRDGKWQYYNCTLLNDNKGYYIDHIVKTIAYKSGVQTNNQAGRKPMVTVLVQPTYRSGRDAWVQYLRKNIKRSLAIVSDKSGTVCFNISKEGELTDIYILNSLGYLYDTNVLDVIKKSSRKWRPAIQNGAPIEYTFTQRLVF